MASDETTGLLTAAASTDTTHADAVRVVQGIAALLTGAPWGNEAVALVADAIRVARAEAVREGRAHGMSEAIHPQDVVDVLGHGSWIGGDLSPEQFTERLNQERARKVRAGLREVVETVAPVERCRGGCDAPAVWEGYCHRCAVDAAAEHVP